MDLNSTVLQIEKMLRRIIGEDIEFVAIPAQDIEYVQADPSQIEQVIVNLAVNARDAMPQGGKLTLEVSSANLDEEYCRSYEEVEPGRYVMLAMSDTGSGIDQDTLSKIFEPFFTTKETGKGSGLGLSTVYGIVKQSNGHISVYSEPGRGTTFKVYFPCVKKQSVPIESEGAATEIVGGEETILLVEDEAAVRVLISKVLRQNGFTVLEGATAEAALQIAGRTKQALDLLITDVVMPIMNGRQLAETLTKSHPGLKVIFMSGYTMNAIVHRGTLDPGLNFLQKPFSPEELLRTLREALDS